MLEAERVVVVSVPLLERDLHARLGAGRLRQAVDHGRVPDSEAIGVPIVEALVWISGHVDDAMVVHLLAGIVLVDVLAKTSHVVDRVLDRPLPYVSIFTLKLTSRGLNGR